MFSRGPPPKTAVYRPPRQVQRGAAAAPSSARGSWTTPKRMIWTGAFAAVTIVGAIYGAGLKWQQDYHTEKKQVLEAPIDERIRTLETRRAQLVNQRRPLEKKLEELRLRVQEEKKNEAPETTDGRS
ncbi:hypothetical protein F4782DRAFT_550961 [Xylaria castorea]|nr:hypothetical protein F4782DRAFT_550961 [Xylaria castorea]